LSDFNQIWHLKTDFYKSPSLSNLIEIRPVRSALIHAERRIWHSW